MAFQRPKVSARPSVFWSCRELHARTSDPKGNNTGSARCYHSNTALRVVPAISISAILLMKVAEPSYLGCELTDPNHGMTLQ